MSEEDVDVELDEDTLTISGEKKQEEEVERGGRYWRESSFGSFVREVPLPSTIDVEQSSASFKNGRLRVNMPKAAQEKNRKSKIEIQKEE
jgi:HSP20 family protein